MGLEFLNRVFRTAIWLGLGLAVIAAFYFGWRFGLTFGLSALWGTLGFKLLHSIVVEATRPDGVRWRLLIPAITLKVLLYAAGIATLLLTRPVAAALLAGIPFVLLVVVLKVLGRALMESEWFSRPIARGREGR